MQMNDEIKKEENFILVLQALVRAAQKNHNVVTRKQLEKAFDGMNLNEQQMQTVTDYLNSNNIGIDEPMSLDDVLTDEEHDYLEDYKMAVSLIEQPSDGVLDAIKLNAMAGDKNAQKQLAECMLPKVIDIAQLYVGQGVYIEDLIGTGNEALVRGTALLGPLDKPEEVEPDLAQRIMSAMEAVIEENLHSRAVDSDAVEKANTVKEKADELADAFGRKVTVEELAAEGEVTEEDIMEALRLTGNKIENIDYKE